jgi:hypothetical protein
MRITGANRAFGVSFPTNGEIFGNETHGIVWQSTFLKAFTGLRYFVLLFFYLFFLVTTCFNGG